MIEGMNNSLERLQLEYVDVIMAHRPDQSTPMEEVVRGFTHLITTGKALYWGTSEWSAFEIEVPPKHQPLSPRPSTNSQLIVSTPTTSPRNTISLLPSRTNLNTTSSPASVSKRSTPPSTRSTGTVQRSGLPLPRVSFRENTTTESQMIPVLPSKMIHS